MSDDHEHNFLCPLLCESFAIERPEDAIRPIHGVSTARQRAEAMVGKTLADHLYRQVDDARGAS